MICVMRNKTGLTRVRFFGAALLLVFTALAQSAAPWPEADRLFHSDPNIVGRGVTLNTQAYTIAGVLRPEFRLNHEVMQTVSNTDILVRYTYYGDADLNGTVNATDYTLVDNGFNMGLTGWVHGDFNYDQLVNGDDYSLMDNAFNTQSTNQVEMKGENIGNLLSSAGLTWGWFQGGFDLTKTNPNGTTGCARSTVSPVISAVSPSSATQADYSPHHQPFQYYPSTRNPRHVRPSGVHTIGYDGDAAAELPVRRRTRPGHP